MSAEKYYTIADAALEIAKLVVKDDDLRESMQLRGKPETEFNKMKAESIELQTHSLIEDLMNAAKQGDIVVRKRDSKVPYSPKIRRDFYELVSETDVNVWLEKKCGVSYRLGNASKSEQKKARRRDKQVDAIVKQAKAFNYPLESIPYSGKAKIKNACLKVAALFTDHGFDHAWKVAKVRKLIEVANKETYSKPT